MTHEHHRKLRSQGGGDEPYNILIVGDEIHSWIHANPEKAWELGWIVPSWEDPANVSVAIPEEILKLKKPRETKPEKPRNRAVVSIRVPKDERENGAEVLDTLIDECRKELLAEDFNDAWTEKVPAYFVLVAVLHDWLSMPRSVSGKS